MARIFLPGIYLFLLLLLTITVGYLNLVIVESKSTDLLKTQILEIMLITDMDEQNYVNLFMFIDLVNG